ncbi:MAG TPA: class I SAM-dependent methyltransferase [Pseudomonadota bacterium]|nr:class I SAM-dependent methyltransferase [Pseudomonadota bacterium]
MEPTDPRSAVAAASPPARPLLAAPLEALLHLAAHFPIIDPIGRGLAQRRRELGAALLPAAQARLRPPWDGVLRGEPAAVAAYDQVVQQTLETLRAQTAAAADPGSALLGRLDRWLYKDQAELLDDIHFPMAQRLQILETLDRLNVHLGSYRRWCEALAPLVAAAAARTGAPVELHDLAAGHGGFAIAVKEYFGARVAVTASDLHPEYLELGRPRARRRGVAIRFVEQDATRLQNLRGSGVALFLCTQSLHHFPPGMVARMLGEATRVAGTGVCFIDGERGYFPLLLAPLMGAYGRSWGALHDTWVSLRRMYLAEELELLGQLAPALPAGAQLAAARLPPGHLMLTIRV